MNRGFSRLAGLGHSLHDLKGRMGSVRRPRRVPVRLQLSATECGAACLAMILSYYGRMTRVSECREMSGVGRDGLTAETIVRSARQFGLRVRAYSVQDMSLFRFIPLPAIVHWKFNHFVVLERWTPHEVELVDPANGRRTLSAAEFEAHFTGVVLTFEPGPHFEERPMTDDTAWHHYLTHVFSTPGLFGMLGQILLVSLFLQLVGLAFPVLTKVLVDDIVPFRLNNVMSFLALGMVVMVLAQAITGYLRAALLIYLRSRIDTRLMMNFFDHILSLPYSYFQQRSSGDLLMRLNSNVTIRELLTNQTVSTILDGGLILVYLIIIFSQSPFFGVLVSLIGLLQAAVLLKTNKQIRDLAQQDLQTQSESQSYLVEALAGIATIKAAGAESHVFEQWTNLFYKHMEVSLKQSHFGAVVSTLMGSLRTFAPLLLLWIGAMSVLNGQMTLGTMLALNALATSFLAPLSSLVVTGQQLQVAGAHLERILDVARERPEQEITAVRPAPPLTGQIELKNVSFRYNANAPYVLRNISLRIKPGQKIAIVGETGSGKSTLARLILALYEPTSGEITYDGLAAETLDYRSLRRQFGVVLQESFLFNNSVRRNIALNNPGLALSEVVQAANLAAIHDEIEAMPMGYETLVSEGGQGLSGGQRQRLSLARALAHHCSVLVLDEATSHLDTITEAEIYENLKSLNHTQIVIAHRLSTIRDADQIVVLHKGEIVERGSHQALLESDGYYAQLVHSQLTTTTNYQAAPNRYASLESLRNSLFVTGGS